MSISGIVTLGVKRPATEVITLGMSPAAAGPTGGGLVTLGYGITPSRVVLLGLAATGVAGTAPSITSQPSDQSVLAGSSAIFSVSAIGTGTLTYQWQQNSGSGFANIVGATSSSYVALGVTLLMTGYQFRCVVTGDTSPPATSNSALLTVSAAAASASSSLAWGVDLQGNFIIIA